MARLAILPCEEITKLFGGCPDNLIIMSKELHDKIHFDPEFMQGIADDYSFAYDPDFALDVVLHDDHPFVEMVQESAVEATE